jgi:hypothetical protein
VYSRCVICTEVVLCVQEVCYVYRRCVMCTGVVLLRNYKLQHFLFSSFQSLFHISVCFTISFIPQSVFKQDHRLSQSQFSTLCDLVLPISNSSTLSFPYGHAVSAYVFLVSPSLISFLLSSILTWLKTSVRMNKPK